MIRKKKLFVKPRKMYEKARILDENKLVEKYGLKNKREIWKALAKVNYFRSRAKVLAKAPLDEQNVLFSKLNSIGLNVKSIADILALKIENLLERRLPTIVYKKSLASSVKQARQMVVHKNILISGKVINIPSYIVSLEEENAISARPGKSKVQKAEANQEIKGGESNG